MIKTVHGNSKNFIERIRNKKFLFVLIISATETIKHQGISAAGASPEMLPYTAALDSEYIEFGEVKSLDSLPVSPAKIVSPAIISKACLNLAASQHLIIDAGAMIKPKIPFRDFSRGLTGSGSQAVAASEFASLKPELESADQNLEIANLDTEGLVPKREAANSRLMNLQLGNAPSRSVETGMALSLAETTSLFQRGQEIAQLINQANQRNSQEAFDYLVIGECVVGGTTTALGLLQALNYDCLGMVSSSIPQGNHDLKAKLIKEGYQNALLRSDFDKQSVLQDPLLAVSAMGDPMQAVAAGLAAATVQTNTPVMLAGGSQMIAVASLIENLLKTDADLLSTSALQKSFSLKNLTDVTSSTSAGSNWKDKRSYQQEERSLEELLAVATTPWVVKDQSAQTAKLAGKVCKEIPLIYSDLDASENPILASYEQGHVKEGVGAGALIAASHLACGIKADEIFAEINRLCLSNAAAIA